MLAVELRQALADARAAAAARASRCSFSCARHGSGSRSACDTAGHAGVEDEAVHVGQLGRQRARQPQVEEAVQRHRAADVDQQHQARAHTPPVLPGEAQRRAAAGDAARGSCAGRSSRRPRRAAPRGAGAGAAAAGRSGASAPRCRARGRARVERAEVGRRQRLARGWRACARAHSSSSSPDRRRRWRASGRRRRSTRALAGVAALRRPLPRGSAAGTRRRTVRRSAAIRRRGRTAAPAGSSAATCGSSTPTRCGGLQHLHRVAAADARSRWRAGSRRTPARRRAGARVGVVSAARPAHALSMPPPAARPPRAGTRRGRRGS